MSNKQKQQYALFKKHCDKLGFCSKGICLVFDSINHLTQFQRELYFRQLLITNRVHISQLYGLLFTLAEWEYISDFEFLEVNKS